jgi:hypothetical protein
MNCPCDSRHRVSPFGPLILIGKFGECVYANIRQTNVTTATTIAKNPGGGGKMTIGSIF